MLALTRWLARDFPVLKQVFGGFGKAVDRWGFDSIRFQCFVRAFLGCCLLAWYWVLKMMGLLCLVCFIVASFVLVLLVVRDLGYPLFWNFFDDVVCDLFFIRLATGSSFYSKQFSF